MNGLDSDPSTFPDQVAPMPPPNVANDWASYATFFRELPYIQTSVFEDPWHQFPGTKIKQGASFKVKPFDVSPNQLGLNIPSDQKFVLKSVKIDSEDIWKLVETGEMSVDGRRMLRQLCLEVGALTHPPLAKHRNIIKLFGFTQDPETNNILPSLIMECAEYGTLEGFMGTDIFNAESWDQKNQLTADIADGLHAIHVCEIVHGDIKPANILVCQNERHTFVAKISDFGYSLLSPKEDQTKYFGTFRWLAPELTQSHLSSPSLASDIYSFGLVTWYIMLGGVDPFRGIDNERVDREKHDGENLLTSALGQCSREDYRVVLHSCLRLSPADRHCGIISEVRSLLTIPNVSLNSESWTALINQQADLSKYGKDIVEPISLNSFPELPLSEKMRILMVPIHGLLYADVQGLDPCCRHPPTNTNPIL
jgi:serine/threonine protein kinase